MQQEIQTSNKNSFSDSILKSYLQLILALASKEKSNLLTESFSDSIIQPIIKDFKNTLELHFIQERNVSFYADKSQLSLPSFSKKIKQYFGKSPSQLIKERVVLEAKKSLHLTHLQINEIATNLNFEDEFYFSRYFKNEVGLSPAKYRKEVGIAAVAKKSI